MVQSPTEDIKFENIIIKVVESVNEGKDMTVINTNFSIEEISVLEEESSQVGLRSLITRICESRGMEQDFEEELLQPLKGADRVDLLQCFVSVLEKSAIQWNDIIVLLKESTFIEDQSSVAQKMDFKSTSIFDETNTMASYDVSSEQPLSMVSSTQPGYKGIKLISENVSSLESMSMVGKIS